MVHKLMRFKLWLFSTKHFAMKTYGEMKVRPRVFLNSYYKNYLKLSKSVPAYTPKQVLLHTFRLRNWEGSRVVLDALIMSRPLSGNEHRLFSL